MTFTRKDFLIDHFEIKNLSEENKLEAVALSEDAFFDVGRYLSSDLSQEVIDQMELGYIAQWMTQQVVSNLFAVPRSQKDVADIARAATLISLARQQYLRDCAVKAELPW